MPITREYAIRVVCSHQRALLLMGIEPNDIRDSSVDLMSALRAGFVVERVTVAEARKMPFGCATCRKTWAKEAEAIADAMRELV